MLFNAPSVAQVQAAFPEWEIIPPPLGKGTFKAAYSARKNGVTEALKLFYVPEFEDSEDGRAYRIRFLGRFEREIRLLGECDTPCLVKLGSVEPHEIEIGGVSFIAYSEQQLVGKPLRELIATNYRPSSDEVEALLRCLVGAITELWERHKCVHRDIKPENIMKLDGDEPAFVLLDLGISFENGGARFTDPGVSPGTPLYRAPEMLDVNYANMLDARTDLYSAGVTVFEFACGEHPLGPFDTGTVEGRILNQPPANLEDKRSDLRDVLYEIIERLNNKRPTLRGNIPLIRKELGMSA